ncbi:MAG TPA: hypothetical protein VEO73_12145, partial [Gemmatimonadales bacterium]|nr:hypothetical protein [Gemmatimonadales bacterium]
MDTAVAWGGAARGRRPEHLKRAGKADDHRARRYSDGLLVVLTGQGISRADGFDLERELRDA